VVSDITLPVGYGQVRIATQLPVLTMVCGYSRWLSAWLIPSRRAEDLFAGRWQHLQNLVQTGGRRPIIADRLVGGRTGRTPPAG
jgi:hypothetical protein